MTPSQTIGPFFTHALPWPDGPYVVPEGTADSFWIRGRVFDGSGAAVPDALVESWQVNGDFRGFGRCPTNEEGRWGMHTVKTPYVAILLFARGLLNHVVTRIYFPDQPADPVLLAIPEPARSTLIAHRAEDGYTFDINLQGEHETVFFSI